MAKAGFVAMMKGEGDVVTGLRNRLQTMIANVAPSHVLAKRQRTIAEPGSDKKEIDGREFKNKGLPVVYTWPN